jgi:hypothetical protein
MLNLLKPQLNSLRLGWNTTKETLTMRGTAATHSTDDLQDPVKELDYKAVCSVILITEVNEIEGETPVAIAFINQKSTGVVVRLHQLSELE